MSSISAIPKEVAPHLHKPERKHLGVLLERKAYLERRLEESRAEGRHRDGAALYWSAEIAALEWAIGQLA